MSTSSQTFKSSESLSVGKPNLMAHMLAYFPSRGISMEVARGLADGGARYLEVQFPFSDPSADGPTIQTAGAMALEAGFTVADGFELVREIVAETGLTVFVMSYGNLVFRRGTEDFVRRSREAGAAGLIIPDLAPGSDEGLYQAGRAQELEIVPVVAPSVTESRLEKIAAEKPHFLYAALRLGITGRYTEIGSENIEFLDRLSPIGTKVVAGFGISSREQVRQLSPYVHALVVGSAFVQTILTAVEADETGGLRERLAAQVSGLLLEDPQE